MSTAAFAQAEPASGLWPKWGPFLDLGGKVGTKRNLGEATLFVPVWQDERSMLFGDLRFRADDQNSHEGNFGLGFRRMLEGGWNAGLYGFYDHRRSPNANLFDQFTAGAELLGTNFDFRVNSYWPFGNTVQAVGGPTTPSSTASVSGTSLVVFTPATLQSMEFALRGFDTEAGVRIPITPAESPYNLRFYAGGFRFDEPSGRVPVIAGPRLRLEFTDYHVPGLWNGTRFTVDGEWQSDDVRGSQFFAGLRLRVPLQGEPRRASFTPQERRMTDTIIRDVDIVASTQTVQIAPSITDTATTTSSGQAITVLNSATTPGANLPTAVANAGSNSTVILSGTFNTSAATALQSGQTVLGSGTLSLTTSSGRVVTATLGGNATITGTVTGAMVTLANNSTFTGLTVSNSTSGGAAAVGVQASGVSNATISDNTITAATSGGNNALAVRVIGSSTNIVISNNTITATTTASGSSANAIVVDGAGSSAKVTGNTLSASATGGGGAESNHTALTNGPTILTGSTGNMISSGSCVTVGAAPTGAVSYTNGTTCP